MLEVTPIVGLNDVVTLLQLLAQRATVDDASIKANVSFCIQDNLYTVNVSMVPIADPKQPAKYLHTANSPRSYDEAAGTLVKKLATNLLTRHTEDSQVIHLLEKVVNRITRKDVPKPAAPNWAEQPREMTMGRGVGPGVCEGNRLADSVLGAPSSAAEEASSNGFLPKVR